MTDAGEQSGVAWGMRTLLAQRAAAIEQGAEPVGWKIGLNAPAIQQLFGLSGPVVGYLLSPTVIPPGQTVSLSGWAKPALEVEVAIRVGVNGEVAALAPALELVDLGDFFDEIGQIVAANVCHRGVVFGDDLTGCDVSDLKVSVTTANGEERAGGPLVEAPAVTVEVVRDFLHTHGAELSPGDRIIAGSLITPLPVEPGDQFDVSFGPLGQLRVAFT